MSKLLWPDKKKNKKIKKKTFFFIAEHKLLYCHVEWNLRFSEDQSVLHKSEISHLSSLNEGTFFMILEVPRYSTSLRGSVIAFPGRIVSSNSSLNSLFLLLSASMRCFWNWCPSCRCYSETANFAVLWSSQENSQLWRSLILYSASMIQRRH